MTISNHLSNFQFSNHLSNFQFSNHLSNSFWAIIFPISLLFKWPATSLSPEHSEPWVNITLMTISKFFITTSFQVIYLQTGELFPTTHCATGVGFASLVSSSVGVSAPYIAFSVSYSNFKITLDIQNDIHDTRTRKNYFYQEKENMKWNKGF